MTAQDFRNTQQYLLPEVKQAAEANGYDIYPAHPVANGVKSGGYAALAAALGTAATIRIDGYIGVYFEEAAMAIAHALRATGKKATVRYTQDAYHAPEHIETQVAPFLGGSDPLFGKKTTLSLLDFFDPESLRALVPDPEADCTLLAGVGAGLLSWQGPLIYIDLPKNELQFRARAGTANNLACSLPQSPKEIYKRWYFVDWVVLNKHKQDMLPRMDVVVDGQRPHLPLWMYGAQLREALQQLSETAFRVRPWFEPGVWGGQWIKNRIAGLNKEVKNYAWSFELIVPENGLLFETEGLLLEVSFDFLMYQAGPQVLGHAFERFQYDFPIRFDFLDTFEGGNLSVQCHPRADYMKAHFGEDFTQEETYYILDAGGDAKCYLGFQENIEPAAFEIALRSSFENNMPLEITRYVQELPSRKHDLFLIPPGTIHASGRNNLVLEISATPYIFTFKMYDWVRPDLDGKPRPLNIERGMANLNFARKGALVQQELVAKPQLMEAGPDWQLFHLPTHREHLYDVHRIHFESSVSIHTKGKCHVLSLVEGQKIKVVSSNGVIRHYHYAETFVIPAAAAHYTLINMGSGVAWVVKAFVK